MRAIGGLPTTRPNSHYRGRLTITSVLAALLAVGSHAAGGGALPTSCGVLITVLGLTVVATAAAAGTAQRTRGPWAPLIALAAGQLGTEALLSAPVDGLPAAPLPAAIVHALAILALGGMLLGADRTADDLNAVLDLLLPRWWRDRTSTVPSAPLCRVPSASSDAVTLFPRSPCTVRGPPVLA